MASPYSAPISATQVGSYFVQQYYQVLQQQPDFAHQFYTDASSIVRVDGDSSESASALLQIHSLITSIKFTAIKIKTINSLDSWNGGVLVVVSGSVKSKDFSGWRNFVQTFFLAPQEKGYFVLNDIFHFANEEVIDQPLAPVVSDIKTDSRPVTSAALSEPPEVEASEYVNAVHLEGNDPVEGYSYQEHQQEPYSYEEHQPQQYGYEEQQEEQYGYEEHQQEQYGYREHQQEEYGFQEPQPELTAESETAEEETPLLDSSTFPETAGEPTREPTIQEHVGEPQKLSYASILRAPKGKSAPPVSNASFPKSIPPPEWHHTSQPAIQQPSSVLPVLPESNLEVTEEVLSQEGELKSVYVRNLPSSVSTQDILQEFKIFGRIKQDGVFLRNRKDVGVCYAFVEFEDVQSVQNAVKASPIQLTGRQVYIEERRPNNSSTSRGGRRGRGRGGRLGSRTGGRGSTYDSSMRSNGFRSM